MLSKRVEVLFDPMEYKRLAEIARQRRQSVGHLLREAAAEKYLGPEASAQQAAVQRIISSDDDLGSWDEVKELLSRRFAVGSG